MSVNVDTAEIANFQRQAAHWWDPQGPMRALHHINGPRVRYIERCAGGLAGKRTVDVGCGGGLLSEALAARGAHVTGIDLADEVLEIARLHGRESGIAVDYQAISAEALAAQQPASFDLVCCLEMLEHVPDPASVIAALATLAKPGATVMLSTINRNPKSFALAVVGAEYVLNLVPRGTHDYAKFIRPSELTAWAREAGLEPVEIRGLRYNPITKLASIGDDIDVNYFLYCRKPGNEKRETGNGKRKQPMSLPTPKQPPPVSRFPFPGVPQAIFFDLDGTLVDTAPDLGGAANFVRGTLGLPPLPLADYRPVASAGARGLLGKAIGIRPDDPLFPARRDAFLDHYAQHLADHSRLFDGFESVLQAYAAHGIRWGVVTNKPKRYTDALMHALRLDAGACAVVSADEVAQAKPAPDGLWLACTRAGVAPERCWYVGDDKRDIDAGRAAGMRTIAAAWGYEGEHPLASWGADHCCAHPLDLLTLLDLS